MGKQILNGVLYGSGEIIKLSPYIYNINEREIGVYVDGKPLYQKTFVGTVQNIAKGTAVTIATITNIDSVANIKGGYVYNFTDTQIYVGIGTYCSVEFNELTNTLSFRQDWTSHTSGTTFDYFFTMQYTKTTDAPGTGRYTTQGTEAHHYSTDEQIVGTWIDGSTVFEKTFTTSTVSIQMNTSAAFLYADYGITNTKDIIDCNVLIYGNNTFSSKLPYQINQYSLTYGIEATQIQIYRTGSPLVDVKFVITLRYTKQTQ